MILNIIEGGVVVIRVVFQKIKKHGHHRVLCSKDESSQFDNNFLKQVWFSFNYQFVNIKWMDTRYCKFFDLDCLYPSLDWVGNFANRSNQIYSTTIQFRHLSKTSSHPSLFVLRAQGNMSLIENQQTDEVPLVITFCLGKNDSDVREYLDEEANDLPFEIQISKLWIFF